MKIALIDSFFSGSHQKWGKDLKKFSKHQIQIFSMVGIHWKWRMHGGAITLSKELNNSKFLPDLILITDMVDVAVFKSLLSPKLINTPILIYFHENQIMYPKSRLDTDIIEKRDNHYGFINFTSALTADKVIFNSKFHLNGFLNKLKKLLLKFPDYPLLEYVNIIKQKSMVIPIGVKMGNLAKRTEKYNPITILWNHRWEYDKNPDQFFKILFKLNQEGINFNLNVIGENFKHSPLIFDQAKEVLKNKILNWGFIESRQYYYKILSSSNILPVTSIHDFFGVSTVEAISQGLSPLLPNRLAYPEHIPNYLFKNYLYNSEEELYSKLKNMILNYKNLNSIELQNYIQKYEIKTVIKKYDKYFEEII